MYLYLKVSESLYIDLIVYTYIHLQPIFNVYWSKATNMDQNFFSILCFVGKKQTLLYIRKCITIPYMIKKYLILFLYSTSGGCSRIYQKLVFFSPPLLPSILNVLISLSFILPLFTLQQLSFVKWNIFL